jgi:hypothetical protein
MPLNTASAQSASIASTQSKNLTEAECLLWAYNNGYMDVIPSKDGRLTEEQMIKANSMDDISIATLIRVWLALENREAAIGCAYRFPPHILGIIKSRVCWSIRARNVRAGLGSLNNRGVAIGSTVYSPTNDNGVSLHTFEPIASV